MNNQTALREKIYKIVSCQDDEIASQEPYQKAFAEMWNKETDQLMALIDTAVQKAVPKKLKRMSIEREYEDYMDGFNDSLDEFQSNWEKVKKGNL